MKASRTKKQRRRSIAQGRKIENNYRKEASGATLIIPHPNRGLIDVYRLRHFSGGTSVICSSLSLLAALSSRCDWGEKTRAQKARERAREASAHASPAAFLSRHLKRSLCQDRLLFLFHCFLASTFVPASPATCYPPGSCCIIRAAAAADWIRRALPPSLPLARPCQPACL